MSVTRFPIVPIHCIRCGGLDGTHALRDCSGKSVSSSRAAEQGSAEPSGSEEADGSAVLRSEGSAVGAPADNEKDGRAMDTTPATIISHPGAVAQAVDEQYRPTTLSQERAYCLKWGAFNVAEAFIGTGGFNLDLSTHRCGLCGGRFPPTGRAMFFLDQHGSFVPLHRGCYRMDVEAWADEWEDGGAA